ncbi:RNA polymerase sigma factor [Limnospira platensis]|uniref:RNA polymerase sigma factor n=1 Tax=Limnospira platensis TaxID=118562 RepID=UPI0004A0E9D0|nr:hypothetical protein APPUASWS_002385 [Arthrospira platensis str. Paraca]
MNRQNHSSAQLPVEFWQQWLEHQDYLWRCCLRQMGNPIEAEDALSEALLKAQEKLTKCTRPIRNWRHWLVKVTWNHCTDILRQRHRQRLKVENVDAIASLSEWGSPEPTPEQICIGWEMQEFLDHAMEELPPKLRETLILHVKEQQSYLEIAQQLLVSPINVRKRISQARGILAARLVDYYSSSGSKRRSVQLEPETIVPLKPKKKGKKNSLPSYTHCWVPLHFTQPTKLESDRIYLGGKKIHFHHIPIVGFRCTSPNLQNWKAIAFTWGEKKFTSIIYPLLGSVALHPTYKTGKRSHLPGGKKNSLPSYTHCWVPLHFTQPTKLESDRIYLGGKKIHFHHIPIVGFRCTSPNLQNWKAIAFTWGEKKFTSIIYPLLGSVALHPTYKTGKRSHLPGGKKNSLPSYTHCWVPLHFTQPTKLESDRIYLGGKKIHFHHIPIVGFRCTSPNLQNWKAIAFTWGEKKFTSIIYPLLGSVALHPTYKTGKRSHLPGGKKNSHIPPQKRLISESQKTLVEPGLG